MAKPDVSGYDRFSDVTDRLDQIVSSVRARDTSLERSLDLFDEAIALGTRAVDLVDKAAFSPQELERMSEGVEAAEASDAADAAASDQTSRSADVRAEDGS